MNFETPLTIWLVLISPWNVTITRPDPEVPGRGCGSGFHRSCIRPAPCVYPDPGTTPPGAAYGPPLVLLS